MALVMSGWRLRGSSSGRGLRVRVEVDFVRVMMSFARVSIESSWGLPRLTGVVRGVFMSVIRPVIMSST